MPKDHPNIITHPNRRRWLAAVTLTGAVGLSNGWMWYRKQQPSPASPSSADDLPPDNLWSQVFTTPLGGHLALVDFKDKPLVLNFWATWCPPCVKELPLLNQFSKDMKPFDWHIMGIAIDQPAAVKNFLSRTPVQFDIGIANDNGINLASQLGNIAGGLPFSVLLDAKGKIKARKLGPIHQDNLTHWVSLINSA